MENSGGSKALRLSNSLACREHEHSKDFLPSAGGIPMKLRLCSSLIVLLSVLLAGFPAAAQVSASDAQLNGTVRDQTGSVIAKAAVSLRNLDTNHIYSATSSSTGFYILANLP